jgi:pimeloyl-ACP methyl ester carboxylesterase
MLVAGACSSSGSGSSTPSATSATANSGPASESPAAKLGTASGTPATAKAPDFVALPGAKASFGKLGNAAYQIEVPSKWNGELVMYAHGFAGFGTDVAAEPPPAALRKQLIAEGYAWAASSFSENGYTPGIGADDTLALKKFFEQTVGKAKRTYLAGASMGGNVVTLSLEHFPGEYDGALAVCGALGGEEEIDFLMSWAAAAEFTSGVQLPIGQGANKMTSALLQQMSPALGTVDNPTQKGKQFIDIIRNLTGGPRPFFLEGFQDQYLANFGLLLLDPDRQSLSGRAATNAGVTYHISDGLGLTDDAINAGIQRFLADPQARDATAHPDAVPTTGNISAPLLTLHGTGDLFVPITQEVTYRQKADAAGKGDLLVQRVIRSGGHCKFTDQELTTAFHDLVGWVRDGKKPLGDDITANLIDAGKQFTDPLRPGDPGTK